MSTMEPMTQAAGPNEVLVLGAGFSRAVSEHLPLTDELGQLAAETAEVAGTTRVPRRGFHDGNFETWLSRIAEDQPHLGETENRENAALFSKMREAIVLNLRVRQTMAFGTDAPSWLYELLSVLHYRRTPVVSFDYDTIVEVGVASHHLWHGGVGRAVTPEDVLNDLPPPAHRVGTYDGGIVPLVPTFRLYKLHGSLDWYAAPDDWTGATLNRAPTADRFGEPHAYDEEKRKRELPGREPFIVPPSATKLAFYRNTIVRELWQGAAKALRAAERIALVGYSLPSADLVFSGLLEEAIRGREVTVEVVNPKPDQVVKNLELMGVDSGQITIVDDDPDCVPSFVRGYRDRAAEAFVADLRAVDSSRGDDTRLTMPWGDPLPSASAAAPVRAIVSIDTLRPDGSLVLSTGPDMTRPGGQAAQVFASKTLSDLLASLGNAHRVVVRTLDGRDVPVVGAWQESADEHHWPTLALVPAGRSSR